MNVIGHSKLGMVALLGACAAEQTSSHCITSSTSRDYTTHRNQCNYAVNTHYCTEMVATNLFGRGKDCKARFVESGGIMVTAYSPPNGGSGLFQSARVEYVSEIEVCRAPERPVTTGDGRYQCK